MEQRNMVIRDWETAPLISRTSLDPGRVTYKSRHHRWKWLAGVDATGVPVAPAGPHHSPQHVCNLGYCIAMSQEAEDSPPLAALGEEALGEEEEDEEYDSTDKAALAGAFGFEDREHLPEGSSQGGDEHKAEQEPQDVAVERAP